MDIEFFEKVKKIVIIALFSDDELMDKLVLKGGNAIDIIYQIALRSSGDVDFSIENEFDVGDMETVEYRIKDTLVKTFDENGFVAFDVNLIEKPRALTDDMREFWGGYQVEFKLVNKETYKHFKHDLDALRRRSEAVNERETRKFKIDISKFEYCQKNKKDGDLDGYTIYVYSPEMILFEKLRAICQQMPEYRDIVANPSQSARARDFFDIYTVMDRFNIDLDSKENKALLTNIFEAKKVPLRFIGLIHKYREFHRQDFVSVQNTVKRGVLIQDFDFYFDYVLKICDKLKTLWVE